MSHQEKLSNQVPYISSVSLNNLASEIYNIYIEYMDHDNDPNVFYYSVKEELLINCHVDMSLKDD